MQTVLPVDVPGWLLFGLLFGFTVSVAVASVFALGSYFFPNRASNGAIRSGESRRRTELRQYLQAIDEPFAEDHFVGGYTVAFYLPKRDIAITFDARAFYAIEAIERPSARAVLVEHEMPGIYLGKRLPFETPDTVFDSLGEDEDGMHSVDSSEAALAVLGLPSNATQQQIKDAYREKAKAVHPDTGGDPETFQQVKDAYATVSENTE